MTSIQIHPNSSTTCIPISSSLSTSMSSICKSGPGCCAHLAFAPKFEVAMITMVSAALAPAPASTRKPPEIIREKSLSALPSAQCEARVWMRRGVPSDYVINKIFIAHMTAQAKTQQWRRNIAQNEREIAWRSFWIRHVKKEAGRVGTAWCRKELRKITESS